ncbi:hypothetical protein [Acidaminococcus fermentans]|uniref:hypothetical protein n=1 Tax=Acidaminococcus fermentans TaxID=905 RepID=UPI001160514D|nr:hypothetical protein [Acidaminococcus fermentans]
MVNVKAKSKDDWKIWHYGTMISPSVMDVDGSPVHVVPRTVCESTGLMCRGRTVYENDWLDVFGNGEHHQFLVVWVDNKFYACEDEEIRYPLKNVLTSESCRIVGNLYD